MKTGMRRLELAELEARDVYEDFLIVRNSKYDKDRVIPLALALARKLSDFVRNMEPNEHLTPNHIQLALVRIHYGSLNCSIYRTFRAAFALT